MLINVISCFFSVVGWRGSNGVFSHRATEGADCPRSESPYHKYTTSVKLSLVALLSAVTCLSHVGRAGLVEGTVPPHLGLACQVPVSAVHHPWTPGCPVARADPHGRGCIPALQANPRVQLPHKG